MSRKICPCGQNACQSLSQLNFNFQVPYLWSTLFWPWCFQIWFWIQNISIIVRGVLLLKFSWGKSKIRAKFGCTISWNIYLRFVKGPYYYSELYVSFLSPLETCKMSREKLGYPTTRQSVTASCCFWNPKLLLWKRGRRMMLLF